MLINNGIITGRIKRIKVVIILLRLGYGANTDDIMDNTLDYVIKQIMWVFRCFFTVFSDQYISLMSYISQLLLWKLLQEQHKLWNIKNTDIVNINNR